MMNSMLTDSASVAIKKKNIIFVFQENCGAQQTLMERVPIQHRQPHTTISHISLRLSFEDYLGTVTS
jgi:hypothetical protein